MVAWVDGPLRRVRGMPSGMPMFGLRYDLRCPAFSGASSAELMEVAIEQCAWADERGFLSVTLSEHHGSEDGYLPSPLVLGAAIAARTRTVRIVIAALIAPLHDPVRLAEDIAVLDVISKGRVIPVLSGGYVEQEFHTFGKKLSDRASAMEAIVPFLKQAWTGEPFEYEGRLIRVTPCPFQKPHPPIFMGGASAPAARRAARLADHFIPSQDQYWDIYRDERVALGKSDPGEAHKSTGNACFVAEDPDAAWEVIAPHAMHEMRAYGEWAEAAGVKTGYRVFDSPEQLRASGDYPIYTPEELVARVRALGPAATVMLHPLVGGLSPRFSWEMLELFEKRVMPELR